MAIVYIHKRLDNNQVFYIGISKNRRRAFETYAKAGNRRNIYWKRIADKYGVIVEITHENICWEEACKIEQYLIEFWRSQNIQLANLTDGGEGTNGIKLSQEQKEKRASFLNNPKVRERQKKAMSRPDVIKKQSEIQKRIYSNLELRKKQSEIQKRVHGTLEMRLLHSKISKYVFSNEEYRKNHSEKMKIARNKPEIKLKYNKIILQYDTKNNFVKEWSSIMEAVKYYKCSKKGIIDTCKKRREFFLNYKWTYK